MRAVPTHRRRWTYGSTLTDVLAFATQSRRAIRIGPARSGRRPVPELGAAGCARDSATCLVRDGVRHRVAASGRPALGARVSLMVSVDSSISWVRPSRSRMRGLSFLIFRHLPLKSPSARSHDAATCGRRLRAHNLDSPRHVLAFEPHQWWPGLGVCAVSNVGYAPFAWAASR